MTEKAFDWKDYCNSQFSKALALAIAIMLFAFLVVPRGESSSRKDLVAQAEIAEAPPDTREKEETQTETEIEIDIPVISEELATEDTPELAEERAEAMRVFGEINATTSSSLQSGGNEEPFDFVAYDEAPVPIGSIKPVYPDFARKANVTGTVMLEVDVYKNGSVGAIRVLRSVQAGLGGIDEAAIKAVKDIKFQPGRSSGNAVDTTVIIPVEFRLN